ncbi:MAG: tellurite resistance TerB family protein [Pseudomonadota bacterium]
MVDINKLVSGLSKSGVSSGLLGGLAGGAISGALMSKKGRKTAGSLLKIGGIAAIGGLAWNAYQKYQRQEPTAGAARDAQRPAQLEHLNQQQFDFAVEPTQTENSTAMLLVQSMIAAALSDGHLSADEQESIFSQTDHLGLDDAEQLIMLKELRNPKSMREIVALVDSPAVAVEVYAASLLAIDEYTDAGKLYLQKLALRLNLPDELIGEIHAQAHAAAEPIVAA